jgi:hypothetical protein
MAKGDYLGKWHAWEYYDEEEERLRVAYTTSADPKLGDTVDCGGRKDRNGKFWAWNDWDSQVSSEIVRGRRVDYNKTTGNWVKIDYYGGGWPSTKVIGFSGDFEPGSDGAKYIFRVVDSHGNESFETHVIGEQVRESPVRYFDGTFNTMHDARTGYGDDELCADLGDEHAGCEGVEGGYGDIHTVALCG